MIHLVGLPHTTFDADAHTTCAFTGKAVKWVRILDMLGEPVTVYWGGPSSQRVVSCLSEDERRRWFGADANSKLPSVVWDAREPYWVEFLVNAIAAVKARIKPGDLVAIWAGAVMQRVVTEFTALGHLIIEPAVGYDGLAQGTFACFESYAWMHHRYGSMGIADGRSYDTVIPGFVDPDEFHEGTDQDYALFMGRLIRRKGPQVASEIAQRAGIPLLVAGAGAREFDGEKITCEDGTQIRCTGYAGVADATARVELLAGASIFIMPTLYIEPFGTVHAEAMMSGVPVLAPDWGAFTESVDIGQDGYRYRTLEQAARLVRPTQALRGSAVRECAISRFSLEAVAPLVAEWLWRVRSVERGGWYEPDYWSGTVRGTEPLQETPSRS